MGRSLLGLLLCAAVVACDEKPPANLNDSGTPGEDAGVDAGDGVDAAQDAGGSGLDANLPSMDSSIVDECDPVAMTGCTAADTKCVIEGGAPGTECVPTSPNDVDRGDPCTGQDCVAGLVCLRDTGTATTAHCRQACDLDSNLGCAPLGDEYECRTSVTQSNWGSCTLLPPICDPYTQDPCDAMQACQPFLRRTGAWEFRCRTAGAAGEGASCGAGTNCARGLACVTDNVTQVTACRTFCEENTDCTAPQTCSRDVPEPPFMFCAE